MNKTHTEMAQHLLLTTFNKVSLSETLGISRPTLNTRLETNKWKNGEKKILEDLYATST